MKNTLTIARRELRSFFDSLVAYVVVGLSMLGVGLWFFVFNGGIWQVDRANFGRMFEALPWLLSLLVIPLVTMRALAEEKRSGTLELLITMPVKDSEVILGKYFAALGMCVILLACSLLYPIAMFVWPWHLGALDWGPIWAGYFGLPVLFARRGRGRAALLEHHREPDHRVLHDRVHAGDPRTSSACSRSGVARLPSATSHRVPELRVALRRFARGLIDTRAVVYYLSISVVCLLVSFRSLESRKWS